jgi:hypothetical protein
MGISGGIRLESSTPGVSSTATAEAFGDFNEFIFDIDLTVTPNFTLTGNFDAVSGNESGYSDTYGAAAGSFVIDANDGTFSYSITLADAVTGGLTTVGFTITGTDEANPVVPLDDYIDTDLITFNFTLCFAAGTQIATPLGDKTVEDLKSGDLVTTADGRTVPVRWIGRTSLHPMFKPADRLDPVLIRKGALDGHVPLSDLVVTADHGMVLDGMVITAAALVNGQSIDWLPWRQFGKRIDYFHIETAAHDVILANGAPTETYIDHVSRQSFDNYREYRDLFGDDTPITELPMPRISAARLVPPATRARLDGHSDGWPASRVG